MPKHTMLTLVALLMQFAPAYASGADPGRLVVASTAPAAALGNSYWRDEERGWFWYEDPAPDEPEKPVTKSAPDVKKEPRRASEIVELEKLQKRLEDYRKIAIMRPTEQNVRRYMELEAKVVRQASYFADVAQRLGWSHSDLDLTLEGRPVNPLAIQAYNQTTKEHADRAIAELAKDHAIFFFFRGDCPYCHAYAPVLQQFATRYGLTVVAISLDGGGIAQFPDSRVDNGISKFLSVTQVPATFLAEPSSGTITPLGFGVLSTDQLIDRLTVMSSPETRKALPGVSQRLTLQ